jgi:hypothetical protein
LPRAEARFPDLAKLEWEVRLPEVGRIVVEAVTFLASPYSKADKAMDYSSWFNELPAYDRISQDVR